MYYYIYTYPDQSKDYAYFEYVCTENNYTDIYTNSVDIPLQEPIYRTFTKAGSRDWALPAPIMIWVINTIKDGETFYFGFENINPYTSANSFDINTPMIDAAFTPVKSLSDPTKKLDYCFFTVVNYGYLGSDDLYWAYGGYLYRSFPELGIQKVPDYYEGGYITAPSAGNFIEANETNKVVLLPAMIGIEDYYLDKIYISNIIKNSYREEAVELDKGIFLISGTNQYPVAERSKKYQIVVLFDITESMSQEEE